jgi:hypothetical protein
MIRIIRLEDDPPKTDFARNPTGPNLSFAKSNDMRHKFFEIGREIEASGSIIAVNFAVPTRLVVDETPSHIRFGERPLGGEGCR